MRWLRDREDEKYVPAWYIPASNGLDPTCASNWVMMIHYDESYVWDVTTPKHLHKWLAEGEENTLAKAKKAAYLKYVELLLTGE